MEKPKTITAQFEDIKYDICNNYYKYPLIYDEEAEGCELAESDHCRNCPLNRL